MRKRALLLVLALLTACGHNSVEGTIDNTSKLQEKACYFLMSNDLYIEQAQLTIEGTMGFYVTEINGTSAEQEFENNNPSYDLARDEEVYWVFYSLDKDGNKEMVNVPVCEYEMGEGSTIQIRAVTSRTFTP